mmetsp:Transcript_27318/g.64953  ORF Transcript_27318/g.64953 Transcript_27318/m.64953 type:complete len:258 (+) Transcript_27318:402-1175(+)
MSKERLIQGLPQVAGVLHDQLPQHAGRRAAPRRVHLASALAQNSRRMRPLNTAVLRAARPGLRVPQPRSQGGVAADGVLVEAAKDTPAACFPDEGCLFVIVALHLLSQLLLQSFHSAPEEVVGIGQRLALVLHLLQLSAQLRNLAGVKLAAGHLLYLLLQFQHLRLLLLQQALQVSLVLVLPRQGGPEHFQLLGGLFQLAFQYLVLLPEAHEGWGLVDLVQDAGLQLHHVLLGPLRALAQGEDLTLGGFLELRRSSF